MFHWNSATICVCTTVLFFDDKKLKVCFNVISTSQGNQNTDSIIKYTTNKYIYTTVKLGSLYQLL